MARDTDRELGRLITLSVNLRVFQHALAWFANAAPEFTFAQRLRYAELMRDCADQLDKGGSYVWDDGGTR